MAKRYLSLPIRSGNYKISEGWVYSKKENEIHGKINHFAIDFTLPRGDKVFAAASGWAIASYYRFLIVDSETKKLLIFKDRPLGFGLGFFVQIYHTEVDRYTQYGHLENVSPRIPFARPRRMRDGRLIPIGHKVSPDRYPAYRKTIWVEKGEVIGFIGDSGLTWGYDDYPQRPDPLKFPSWDETHLHFEEFARDKTGRKIGQRDPYDVRKTYQFYSWPGHMRTLGPNLLWEKVEQGLPK